MSKRCPQSYLVWVLSLFSTTWTFQLLEVFLIVSACPAGHSELLNPPSLIVSPVFGSVQFFVAVTRHCDGWRNEARTTFHAAENWEGKLMMVCQVYFPIIFLQNPVNFFPETIFCSVGSWQALPNQTRWAIRTSTRSVLQPARPYTLLKFIDKLFRIPDNLFEDMKFLKLGVTIWNK